MGTEEQRANQLGTRCQCGATRVASFHSTWSGGEAVLAAAATIAFSVVAFPVTWPNYGFLKAFGGVALGACAICLLHNVFFVWKSYRLVCAACGRENRLRLVTSLRLGLRLTYAIELHVDDRLRESLGVVRRVEARSSFLARRRWLVAAVVAVALHAVYFIQSYLQRPLPLHSYVKGVPVPTYLHMEVRETAKKGAMVAHTNVHYAPRARPFADDDTPMEPEHPDKGLWLLKVSSNHRLFNVVPDAGPVDAPSLLNE